MSKARDFGVQSYCFRETKKNEDVAKGVIEIGLGQDRTLTASTPISRRSARSRTVAAIYKQGRRFHRLAGRGNVRRRPEGTERF